MLGWGWPGGFWGYGFFPGYGGYGWMPGCGCGFRWRRRWY